MRLTASQLERLAACPGGAALPSDSSSSEAAERGTVGHRFLERVPLVGREAALAEVEEDELRELLEETELEHLPVGVEYAQEVALAYDVTTGKARELARGATRAEAYADLRGSEVGGIIDVVALAPGHVAVWDWKFGHSRRAPVRRNWQIRALCLMAARAYGKPEAVGALVRLEPRPWMSRALLDAFALASVAADLRQLHERVAHERQHGPALVEVSMGPHCRWCDSHRFCPGQTSLVRQLGAGDLAGSVDEMLPLSSESFARAWSQIDVLGQLYKRAKSAALAYARHHGPIPLGDGKEIREVIEPGNEKLSGTVVHEVLTDMRGPEVADAAVGYTATKKAVKAALKASLADDEKLAPLERTVLSEVRARGGAHRPTRQSVKVVEVG